MRRGGASGRRASAEERAEWFEILDTVFPYPYRGAACLFSKRYRERVKQQYRKASRGFVLVDSGLSGLLLLGEVVLVLGLPLMLWLGD